MATVKNILIVAAIGLAVWFFISWQNRGEEMKRNEANYENALLLLKQEHQGSFSEFTFKKNQEIEEFLEYNHGILNGLEAKLQAQDIKLNRITRIVSTSIDARDTIINNIDLDGLAERFAEMKHFTMPFVDSTKCFYTKMQLVYEDGKTSVQVYDRKFTDTITDVTSWERRQWKLFGLIPTRIFGKKIANVTLISNCGNTKTLTIQKK